MCSEYKDQQTLICEFIPNHCDTIATEWHVNDVIYNASQWLFVYENSISM